MNKDKQGTAKICRREFLRYAEMGIFVGTIGLKPVRAQSPQQSRSLPIVDRSKFSEFPTLSLKERDRRWNAARKMMQDNRVDCLLVVGGGRDLADNYFTNDFPSTVIFSIAETPTALVGTNASATIQAGSLLQNEERGEVSWVRDWRFGKARPSEIVEILKRKGFANSRIGTIGIYKGSHFERDGSAGLGNYIKQNLPQATLVELWDQFVTLWLVHSEEELVVFRRAALLGEAACEAMMKVTKPGVTEADIYHAIQCEIMKYGGTNRGLILHSGVVSGGWGAPRWTRRAQKPPAVKEGDVVWTEIFPQYGHMEAQQQMCIGVGKVADIYDKLARTAREICEIGLKAVKPGAKWSDVCKAMNEPNIREGYWHLTPNIHTINPLDAVSEVTLGIEQFPALLERFGKDNLPQRPVDYPDLVLQPGMTLAFETNSSSGRYRINIGGSVIVTKDGCEEINNLPNYFRIVG